MDEYEEIEKTTTNTKQEKVEGQNQYSNCFVLIQHDLELKKTVEEGEGDDKKIREEKKYVTFYSLYNHLLPVNKMNDKSLVPEIMAITKSKVVENEGFEYPKKTIRGLYARKTNSKGNIVKGAKGVKFIIPYGELVTKQFNPNKEPVIVNGYTKIKYNGKYGYIYAKEDRTLDLVTQIQITTKEDRKLVDDTSGVPNDKKDLKGARVRKTGKGSKVVDIIPNGDEVIVEEKNGNWYKVKGYEGYSHKSNFKDKKEVDKSKITTGKIVADDIPIKGGDCIGYTGLMQLNNGNHTTDYYTSHVEVFMADEVEAFLNNDFGAGNDKKHYVLLKEGIKLKKEITKKVNLKKNLPIKIIDVKGIYVKIKEHREEIEGVVRLLEVNHKGKKYDTKEKKLKDYYFIKKSSFDTVNFKFKNKLPEKGVTLFWVDRVNSKGIRISRTVDDKLNDNQKYRKLRYTPVNSTDEYWVEAKDLMPTVEYVEVEEQQKVPKKLTTWETLKDYFFDIEKFEIKTIRVCKPKKLPFKKGEKTTITKDITKAYLAIPEKKNDVEEELCKDVVININKAETITVDKDNKFIKIECTYPIANEKHTQKGWVKINELNIEKNAFSAYNWNNFSFKPLKAGNEYMYDIKGLREETKTYSKFIKEVWRLLDFDGNNEIELNEVKNAYNVLETRNQLTKLVCQHKNEWSYNANELTEEIEKYFDYFINHKDTEEYIKPDLEKLKNKKLDAVKQQVEKLMFWQDTSTTPYTPNNKKNKSDVIADSEKNESKTPEERARDENGLLDLTKHGEELQKEEDRKNAPKQEKEKPKRTFPSTENVYHFHPIAFVNHMKLIFGEGKTNHEAMIRAFLRVIKKFEGVPGEKGYTTLFGGGQFSDTTTHPEEAVYWYTKSNGTKVYSTAAGAYQIMKETWWDYNGEVVKDHKKTGKYNKNRDFVKKYGIKDFSPKSQDEFCIALLKHARPPKAGQKGLIDDLLNGYVTLAIESYASHIWASLSPGRYPNQGPTKHAKSKQDKRDAIHEARIKQLKLYDKFLAEELAGESDLYLETGFLKKFGIEEPKSREFIENKKEGLDLNKVIEGLNKRASAPERISIIGKCAKYVRLALEDGGMSTVGRPNAAADYVSFLPKKGFKEVSDGNYQIGDIAVFERFQGVKKYHKYGHIQMYNGEKWVSDFFQTGFWAGSDYRTKKPNYKIFRWE